MNRSLFLVAFFMTLCVLAEELALVHVKAESQVTHADKVSLGDIAEFIGFSNEEEARLKSIVLSDAPAIGEVRKFSNRNISEIIRKSLSSTMSKASQRVQFQIPSEVTVKNPQVPLEAATVMSDLKKQWASLCLSCEIEITNIRLPLIDGAARMSDWTTKAGARLPKGSFSIPIEIVMMSPSREKKTLWVTGQARVMRTVPVARRLIESGSRIQEEDFTFEKQDVTFLTDGFPEQRELIGAQTRRPIRAQQAIAYGDVERERAVKRGQQVRVTSGASGWEVSVLGYAEQDGFIGDLIPVKRANTQQKLHGKIIAKGIVEVQ